MSYTWPERERERRIRKIIQDAGRKLGEALADPNMRSFWDRYSGKKMPQTPKEPSR